MCNDSNSAPLLPWMRFLLIFAGYFNLMAGTCMFTFYHEGYRLLDIPKPELVLPVQVMGILVAMFGAGYLLVAQNPLENRHILLLGFWSKALSSALALSYVAGGELPLGFLPVLFFADIVYLPPFYMIMRRIYRLASISRHN